MRSDSLKCSYFKAQKYGWAQQAWQRLTANLLCLHMPCMPFACISLGLPQAS